MRLRRVDLLAQEYIYEFLVNVPPFHASDELKMYKKIKEVSYRWPIKVSPAAKDLVGKLLRKSPSSRLGFGGQGIGPLKKHKWFANLDWDALARRSIPAPFIPDVGSQEDLNNFYDVSNEAMPGSQTRKPYVSKGLFSNW